MDIRIPRYRSGSNPPSNGLGWIRPQIYPVQSTHREPHWPEWTPGRHQVPEVALSLVITNFQSSKTARESQSAGDFAPQQRPVKTHNQSRALNLPTVAPSSKGYDDRPDYRSRATQASAPVWPTGLQGHCRRSASRQTG